MVSCFLSFILFFFFFKKVAVDFFRKGLMGLYYNSAQVWGCLEAISYPRVLWNPQSKSHRDLATSSSLSLSAKGEFLTAAPFPSSQWCASKTQQFQSSVPSARRAQILALPMCQLQPLTGNNSPCQKTTHWTKAEPPDLHTVACWCCPLACWGGCKLHLRAVGSSSALLHCSTGSSVLGWLPCVSDWSSGSVWAQLQMMLNSLCVVSCNVDTAVGAFEQSPSAGVIHPALPCSPPAVKGAWRNDGFVT